MNDPQVVALIYKIRHSDTVEYSNAPPLDHDDAEFKVRVDAGEARFELKIDCPTVDAAREIIDPFILKWEFIAALERAPREFELVYDRAEVVDRKPSPNAIHLEGARLTLRLGKVEVRIGRGAYPRPPFGLVVNADAAAMAQRFSRYRQGNDTLAAVSYFCLTVLEDAAGNRTKAASRFGIAAAVLSTLGRLSTEKGGADARKSVGRGQELSGVERAWLEAALVLFIRRAAEVAHDSAISSQTITMADLPPI